MGRGVGKVGGAMARIVIVLAAKFISTRSQPLLSPRSNVAPSVAPFRYPKNYFCASRNQNHVMVMEDLSSFGVCGAGFKGSATLEECRSIMIYMARLHAHFWGKRSHKDSPSTVQNLFAGADLSIYPLIIKKVFPDAIKVMRKAFPEVVAVIGESCMTTLSKRWKSIAKR